MAARPGRGEAEGAGTWGRDRPRRAAALCRGDAPPFAEIMAEINANESMERTAFSCRSEGLARAA